MLNQFEINEKIKKITKNTKNPKWGSIEREKLSDLDDLRVYLLELQKDEFEWNNYTECKCIKEEYTKYCKIMANEARKKRKHLLGMYNQKKTINRNLQKPQ